MKLPSYRRIQTGRTFDRVYDPANYTPITGPYGRNTLWSRSADPIITIIIIAVLAIPFILS